MSDKRITIDLSEYNELIEFKEKMNGGFVAMSSSHCMYRSVSYMTRDEAIEKLMMHNRTVARECDEFESTNTLLRAEIYRLEKRKLWDYIKELIWK